MAPVDGGLLVLHLVVLPRLLSPGEHLMLGLGTTAAAAFAVLYRSALSSLRFSAYVACCCTFLGVVAVDPRSAPLVGLYLMLFAALARIPRLLLHFCCFVLTVELLPQYFAQLWPVLFLLLEALFHAFARVEDPLVGWCFLLGFMLLGGILIPVLGMVFGCSVQTLSVTAADPTVLGALGTSLLTATTTTLVSLALGVPLAYALARSRFWGREALVSLVDVPILVPQSVAGVALLMVFGPKTTIGRHLADLWGLEVVNSLFAIVVAQIFVSAPFLIRASLAAFLKVDRRLEYVSRSLGASQLRTFVAVRRRHPAPGHARHLRRLHPDLGPSRQRSRNGHPVGQRTLHHLDPGQLSIPTVRNARSRSGSLASDHRLPVPVPRAEPHEVSFMVAAPRGGGTRPCLTSCA